MIRSDEAEKMLLIMLKEANFNFDNPDAKLAWEVFKDFFAKEVDCADDVLLFKCGVSKLAGEELFHLQFIRQFIFERNEEYDHMEQLKLKTYFKPCCELEDLETSLWLYDCNSSEEFFNKVENMNNFKIPVENYVPLRAEIEQERI